MNTILESHDLTVSYDSKPVLWGIDFAIPSGTLTGIVGPNGSGKSTLLKSIMGLIAPDSGFTRAFGQELPAVRSRIAYVPQKESVDWDFPANVLDIALMGSFQKKSIFGRYSSADKSWAYHCLEKVGMQEFAQRQIAQLSGGQQQRTFLARALVQNADLYILDEPFAGVDITTENSVMEILKSMQNEGKTSVVVHHDLQTVEKYFDYLLMLNTRLVASGYTKEVFTPENLEDSFGSQLTLLSKVMGSIQGKESSKKEHDRL